MIFQIVFYWDRAGRQPVREFLLSLDVKTRRKISQWLQLLQKEGPFLRRPYADKVSGKLYELRVRFGSDNIRILYFFYLRDKIVLLHAFRKKDWEIKQSDIRIAENRMHELIARYEEGQIEI